MADFPKVFLSYSWANKSEADHLDKYFDSVGLRFKRDVRDLKFKSSIKEFMQKVRESDFVIMLISHEFLHSRNCMYEVTELMSDRNYQSRLLQVVLPNAKIFDPDYRLELIKFWQKKKTDLEIAIKGIEYTNLGELANDLKELDNIASKIYEFVSFIADEICVTYEELVANNFNQLLSFIGYDSQSRITDLLSLLENSKESNRIRELHRFVLANPTWPYGYYTLGYFYDDVDDKIQYFDLAIEHDSNFAEAYLNRGNSKLKAGDVEGAHNDYNRAVEIDPSNDLFWHQRGICKSSYLGNKEGAIVDFSEALKLNPNYALAFYNRGITRHDLGDSSGAMIDYDSAIEIENKSDYYYNRGLLKSELKDLNGALRDYDRAIALNSKKSDSYGGRSLVFWEKGDLESALKDLDSLLTLSPVDWKGYSSRASLKAEMERYADAVTDYGFAILINGEKDGNLYKMRAANYSKLGKFALAKDDFDIAIKINPVDIEALEQRAYHKIKLEDNNGAIEDYNEIIKLDPKNSGAMNNRGILRKSQGLIEQGEEDIKAARIIDNSNHK